MFSCSKTLPAFVWISPLPLPSPLAPLSHLLSPFFLPSWFHYFDTFSALSLLVTCIGKQICFLLCLILPDVAIALFRQIFILSLSLIPFFFESFFCFSHTGKRSSKCNFGNCESLPNSQGVCILYTHTHTLCGQGGRTSFSGSWTLMMSAPGWQTNGSRGEANVKRFEARKIE